MAYAATAGGSLPAMTAAPGVLALQRALVWLGGACGAIVFVEPSPYELATLAASLIFFATGLRMRLGFGPPLPALFPAHVGYPTRPLPFPATAEGRDCVPPARYLALTA